MIYFRFEKIKKTIIMKKFNLYLVTILAIVAFSCSDDDGDGTSTAESGSITFTVDGEEKSFDGLAFYSSDDNVTNITNIETGIPDISIVFQNVAPGDEITLDLQDSDDNSRVSIQHVLDPDGDILEGSYGNANLTSTEGQITITEYTDSKISGEFNAVLKNLSSDEITIENGSFSDLNVSESGF